MYQVTTESAPLAGVPYEAVFGAKKRALRSSCAINLAYFSTKTGRSLGPIQSRIEVVISSADWLVVLPSALYIDYFGAKIEISALQYQSFIIAVN